MNIVSFYHKNDKLKAKEKIFIQVVNKFASSSVKEKELLKMIIDSSFGTKLVYSLRDSYNKTVKIQYCFKICLKQVLPFLKVYLMSLLRKKLKLKIQMTTSCQSKEKS